MFNSMPLTMTSHSVLSLAAIDIVEEEEHHSLVDTTML